MELTNDSIDLPGTLGIQLLNFPTDRLVVDPECLWIGRLTCTLQSGDRLVGVRPRSWPINFGWKIRFDVRDDLWESYTFRSDGAGLFLDRLSSSPSWTVEREKTAWSAVYNRTQ